MSERDLILDFIRGDLLWTKLSAVGIDINFIDDDNCEIIGKNRIVVVPEVEDIIIGILKLYKMTNAIQKWATIILGSSNIIDLKKIESDINGDEILNILWDLSGGIELNNQQLELLKVLTNSKPSS